MHTVRQYWESLFSRLKQRTATRDPQAVEAGSREHEIAEISSQNQVLAEQVQRFRADLEHVRDEENRQGVDLEQVRHTLEHARGEDARKLAELESSNSRLASAMEADSSRLRDLGTRLAEFEAERGQARDQVKALEAALAETSSRLVRADTQIKNLQAQSIEQRQQLEASLSDAGSRLESLENQHRILGVKLDSERKQVLKHFQVVQERVSKQHYRLNWTLMAAVFALLLGAVAGGAQLWQGQKNTALLAEMSRDIKSMKTRADRGPGSDSAPGDLAPAQALQPPAVHGGIGTATTTDTGAAEAAQPAATEATGSDEPGSDPVPAEERPRYTRQTFAAGERQYTRQDARKFFEENAANADVTTLPSGVQYRVIRFGSGKSPTLSDRIVVSYVAIRPDGAVTSETYSDGVPMTISMKQVLPGWQEVLLEMREGAEFELYVPSNVEGAGGVRKRSSRGFEPNIYLIELLQVVESAAAGPSGAAN